MTHLYYYPEHADDRFEVGESSPKKRRTRIRPSDPAKDRVGWGIHLEEGMLPGRILMWTSVIFVGGSIAFGISWTILEHDIQGAWGVAAWVLTLGGIVAMFVQFFVQ